MPLVTDDEPTIAEREAAEPLVANGTAQTPSPAQLPPVDAHPSMATALTKPLAAFGPPCEICGAPARGRRLCVECDPPADMREHAPPLGPRDAMAVQENAGIGHRRRRLMIIAILLVLLLVGGATALVLRDDSEPQPAASSVARPAASSAAGAGDAGSTGPSPTNTEYERTARPRAAAAAAETGPEHALRDHWEAIAAGDFATAYDRFSSTYRRSHDFPAWSRGLRGYRPDVEVVEIEQIAKVRDHARVRLVVATRDRGKRGDASRCHIFRGRVNVVREHGTWLYDPPGLREKRRGGIDPSSDDRCHALFR
jgi:hypothetical protein